MLHLELLAMVIIHIWLGTFPIWKNWSHANYTTCNSHNCINMDATQKREWHNDFFWFIFRRYFFLITFRSYLYCTSATKMQFTAWMDARPELGHLCNNLKINKWSRFDDSPKTTWCKWCWFSLHAWITKTSGQA